MPSHLRATDASGEPVSFGTFNGFEVYPMPMFATIGVADVAGVAAWYEAALGFRTMFSTPGPGGAPALVHLRRSKYQDVLITPGGASEAGAASSHLTITFRADEDPEALASRARAVAPVGASAVVGPIDTPWNTTDVRVTDPLGHRLVFTAARANPDPEQQAKWSALMEQARRTS